MRAVTFSRFGGPEVLEVADLPEPQPGPGEVRIRVAAATVNPTDIGFRAGRHTTAPLTAMGARPPYIPGMELARGVGALGRGARVRPADERADGAPRAGPARAPAGADPGRHRRGRRGRRLCGRARRQQWAARDCRSRGAGRSA